MLRLFTMKCSFPECNRYFHPICTKEGFHYSNFTYTNSQLIGVCLCEEHSQKFLIESVNFNNI